MERGIERGWEAWGVVEALLDMEEQWHDAVKVRSLYIPVLGLIWSWALCRSFQPIFKSKIVKRADVLRRADLRQGRPRTEEAKRRNSISELYCLNLIRNLRTRSRRSNRCEHPLAFIPSCHRLASCRPSRLGEIARCQALWIRSSKHVTQMMLYAAESYPITQGAWERAAHTIGEGMSRVSFRATCNS